MMNLNIKILWNKLCIFILNILVKISNKFTQLLQHYRDMVENVDYIQSEDHTDDGDTMDTQETVATIQEEKITVEEKPKDVI